MKLELSEQILEKFSSIKFHKNPFSGSRVVPCGRTDMHTDRMRDRHDKANRRFLQFSEHTPKNGSINKWCMYFQDLTHTRLSQQCCWKAKGLSDMKLCRWVNSSRSFEE